MQKRRLDHSSVKALIADLNGYRNRWFHFSSIDPPWKLVHAEYSGPHRLNLTMRYSDGSVVVRCFTMVSKWGTKSAGLYEYEESRPWVGILTVLDENYVPPGHDEKRSDKTTQNEAALNQSHASAEVLVADLGKYFHDTSARFCFVSADGQKGPQWRLDDCRIVDEMPGQNSISFVIERFGQEPPKLLLMILHLNDGLLHLDSSTPYHYGLLPDENGCRIMFRKSSDETGRVRQGADGDGWRFTSAEGLADALRPHRGGNPRFRFVGVDPDDAADFRGEGCPWYLLDVRRHAARSGMEHIVLTVSTCPDDKTLTDYGCSGNSIEIDMAVSADTGLLRFERGLSRWSRASDNPFFPRACGKPVVLHGWQEIQALGTLNTKFEFGTDSSSREPIEELADAVSEPANRTCAVCDMLLQGEETGDLCRGCTAEKERHRQHTAIADKPAVKKPGPRWVGILALLAVMAIAYNSSDWFVTARDWVRAEIRWPDEHYWVELPCHNCHDTLCYWQDKGKDSLSGVRNVCGKCGTKGAYLAVGWSRSHECPGCGAVSFLTVKDASDAFPESFGGPPAAQVRDMVFGATRTCWNCGILVPFVPALIDCSHCGVIHPRAPRGCSPKGCWVGVDPLRGGPCKKDDLP